MAPSRKIPLALLASAALAATAIAAPIAEGGRKFVVQMTDEAEVAPAGLAGGSGTATLVINPGQRRVCYDITVNSVVTADGITMAHIHSGTAGVAGPAVVTLFEGSGPLSDCVDSTLTSAQLARIVAKPSLYYVNVHSTSEPFGAVRGQLSR